MKNAELKLVRFADADVIATSTDGPQEIWSKYNRAVFWNFAGDSALPGLYLYDNANGNPNTGNITGDSSVKTLVWDLFDKTGITFTNFEETYVNNSTLNGTPLSNFWNETDSTTDYNGIYSFIVSGNGFVFSTVQ